jgi:hypothetical protein
MSSESRIAHLVSADHRIQYTNPSCGPEWAADICKFEDYLVSEATRLKVDLLAEEFSEELVRRNCASGCTVRDAASRAKKPHLFCDPDLAERERAQISNDDLREQEWLARIQRARAHRPLMVCGDNHIESFGKHLRTAGFEVSVLSRNWGHSWELKN